MPLFENSSRLVINGGHFTDMSGVHSITQNISNQHISDGNASAHVLYTQSAPDTLLSQMALQVSFDFVRWKRRTSPPQRPMLPNASQEQESK